MAQRSVRAFQTAALRNNPVFVQGLGLCPALAVTSTAVYGLSMGLATSFVVICAMTIATLLKRFVPDSVRIPVYAVVIATFVTIADQVMRAFFPDLSAALGPYVPLIVVNCMILGRVEAFARKNPVAPTIGDAVGTSVAFTGALVLLGAFRELLGQGNVFGVQVMGEAFEPLGIMGLPTGAFFGLAVLWALFNAARAQGKQQAVVRP